MEHPGEELVYVLDGTLQVEVDDVAYLIHPGDTLHFRTDRPHRWTNPDDQSVHALWMTLRQP
jgi:quercetin dioxygenase-like cupin family protein